MKEKRQKLLWDWLNTKKVYRPICGKTSFAMRILIATVAAKYKTRKILNCHSFTRVVIELGVLAHFENALVPNPTL